MDDMHVNNGEGFLPCESNTMYQYESSWNEEMCWALLIGIKWVIMPPIMPIGPKTTQKISLCKQKE